jgi:hypothetical protein
MSQLQKIIKQPKGNTGTTSYSPKSDDEQAFVDKHEIQFTDDANGNGDDVFKGMIVKKISRASSRHGYDSPKDQSVNESLTDEELNQLIEMSAKMKKKRHEISLALKRENPDWSMDKVFAIATSAAQKAVKEEYGLASEEKEDKEESGEYMKGVRRRVAQRRSELYKDYADKDEKSGKSNGSVYRKMAKRQAELAKEEFDSNDIDVSILELYLDLDDDNKAILIEMLDNGLEDLISEFIAENKNA